MSLAATKEYLKMIFKNDTADMLMFITGIIVLSITNPELFPLDLLQLVIKISILISFGSIIIRICLNVFRNTYLHIGETMNKYKQKDWQIEKTLQETVVNKIIPEEKEVTSAAEIKKEE